MPGPTSTDVAKNMVKKKRTSSTLGNNKDLPLPKGNDKSMKGLNGWTNVGYYGSCQIYAKGNKRRLVDPKTGQTTFEYEVTNK